MSTRDLQIACSKLDLAEIKKVISVLLITYGGSNDNSLLINAIETRNYELIKFLLEILDPSHIVDKNVLNGSAVDHAIMSDNHEMIDMFIPYISKNTGSLHCAFHSNCSAGTMKKILPFVNVNEKDSNGDTVLHNAIESYNLETIELLLPFVDLSVKDDRNRTCLHIAALNGYLKIIQMIIDRKPEKHIFNEQDCYGNTALHLAAKYDYADCVDVLSGFCDINIKNSENETATHLAIKNKNKKTTGILWNEKFDLAEYSKYAASVGFADFEKVLADEICARNVWVDLPTVGKVAQPASEKIAQPAGEKIIQPAGEKITQPAGEKITQPAGEKITQSAGEKITQSAGEKITQSAAEKITQSAGEKITQPAGEKITQSANTMAGINDVTGVSDYIMVSAEKSDESAETSVSPGTFDYVIVPADTKKMYKCIKLLDIDGVKSLCSSNFDWSAQINQDLIQALAGIPEDDQNSKKIVEIGKILISKCNLNDVDKLGDTPLITAIRCKNYILADMLVLHPNTNLEHKNYIGQTASGYARQYKRNNLVQLIETMIRVKKTSS